MRRVVSWHSAPWWGGVGSIAGVLGVIIALVVPPQDDGPDKGGQGATPTVVVQNGATAAESGDPVKITPARRVHAYTAGDGHVFADAKVLTPAELDDLNSRRISSPEYEAWFADRHAVDPGKTEFQFIVVGRRDGQVRIVDIRPVVQCGAALSGTLFTTSGSGGESTTKLIFDLEKPQTAPKYVENDKEGEDYFGSHTVSLKLGEQFTFDIAAMASTRYCQFTLEMTVQDGDKPVVVKVDDKGQPFKVTGGGGPFQVLYIGGINTMMLSGPDAGKWHRADPVTGKVLTGNS